MKKYKLAIIGSGSLGSIIGKVVSQDLNEEYEILGVLSGKLENAIKLADEIDCKAYNTLNEIIDDQPDYIIEAASPDVFKEMGIEILANGINIIIETRPSKDNPKSSSLAAYSVMSLLKNLVSPITF